MWGAKDATIPLASGQWFAQHIKGAELVTYPDLGHIPMEEDPLATVTDLLLWLNKEGQPTIPKR
jgi:pimeloyl-ACP methyl ester carboxylesterase